MTLICDDINRIRNAGKRLLTMISEILDLAKLDAGRVKVDKKPLKFSALANQLQARESQLLIAPSLFQQESTITFHNG